AQESGDKAFQSILESLENIVKSVTKAKMANWQNVMQKVIEQLENLDNLAKKIDKLNTQDRVRQFLRMIDKASKI
ncbi:MAG: hypothetical protein ACFFD2_14170, partial [Promethearchaeota archaeon]